MAVSFFEEINRIGMPEYVPNTMDVLKARARSTGVSEYRFRVGTLAINMFDLGGQRPERKSWVQSFEGVMTIIFCVALSEYDQFLLEQPEQNRLLESFQLFSDIVRSRWFINSSIVLFLNKKDIFQEKLKKVPLQNYFPDYEGTNDIIYSSLTGWGIEQLINNLLVIQLINNQISHNYKIVTITIVVIHIVTTIIIVVV